jgi:AcrR family transcriptional regulator
MSVDARQRQLLEIAAEVFATAPYEEAQIEEIARRADVAPSLIYHYFRNKRDLFAAVVDMAIEELGRMTAPNPELPPLERFRAALDAYIDYVQLFEHAYRAMHRGRHSGDARVQAAIERNTKRQIERICVVFFPNGDAPAVLELAARGALALNVEACLHWLEHRQITRAELRELLVDSYMGAVRGALAPTTTPETETELDRLIAEAA